MSKHDTPPFETAAYCGLLVRRFIKRTAWSRRSATHVARACTMLVVWAAWLPPPAVTLAAKSYTTITT